MIDVPIVLDTSVVLNLLATGIDLSLLKFLGVPCFICSAVIDEAIYVRGDDPTQPREAVTVDWWLQSGVVSIVSPNTIEEEELYVQFAAELDDGEAMSLAICRARAYALATDDLKARRIVGRSTLPEMQLVSTSQIIHHWAVRTNAHPAELKRVLSAVERRARFIPPNSDPLRNWWIKSPFDSQNSIISTKAKRLIILIQTHLPNPRV